jgi:hypothetical protein
MSSNGPSADEVARVLRRQELVSKLEAYSPKEFQAYKTARSEESFYLTVGFVIVIVVAVSMILLAKEAGFIPGLLTFAAGGVVIGLLGKYPESDEILWKFEKRMHKKAIKQDGEFRKMAKTIDETAAKAAGELIILGQGAIYIKDSTIKESFNVLKTHDPELANALSIIAGYIESNKIEGAVEAYDNLAEAITQKDKPSRIRAFWNDLISIAPAIATLATAAATIKGLF